MTLLHINAQNGSRLREAAATDDTLKETAHSLGYDSKAIELFEGTMTPNEGLILTPEEEARWKAVGYTEGDITNVFGSNGLLVFERKLEYLREQCMEPNATGYLNKAQQARSMEAALGGASPERQLADERQSTDRTIKTCIDTWAKRRTDTYTSVNEDFIDDANGLIGQLRYGFMSTQPESAIDRYKILARLMFMAQRLKDSSTDKTKQTYTNLGELFLTVLDKEKDERARNKAIEGLGHMGYDASKSIPAILQAMGTGGRELDFAAAWALGSLGGNNSTDENFKGLQRKIVRRLVAVVLDNPYSYTYSTNFLGKRNFQGECLKALEHMGVDNVVPYLLEGPVPYELTRDFDERAAEEKRLGIDRTCRNEGVPEYKGEIRQEYARSQFRAILGSVDKQRAMTLIDEAAKAGNAVAKRYLEIR